MLWDQKKNKQKNVGVEKSYLSLDISDTKAGIRRNGAAPENPDRNLDKYK